jgi:hypothetical protein
MVESRWWWSIATGRRWRSSRRSHSQSSDAVFPNREERKKQKTKNKEQKTKNKKQRTKNKEQRTKDERPRGRKQISPASYGSTERNLFRPLALFRLTTTHPRLASAGSGQAVGCILSAAARLAATVGGHYSN